MKIATLALSAAVLALPGVAMAQTQGQTQQQAAITNDYRDIDDIRVVDAQGNKIGEVEEAVIDQNGQVAFVVEFEDGFLGLNDHEVIVPADRLTFDAQNRRFTSNMAESDLKGLQEWDD